jgi:cytochrome c biogenesis protein CcdA
VKSVLPGLTSLVDAIGAAGWFAPLVALLAGVVLTISPLSWASIPAAVALVAPSRAAARVGGEAALGRMRAAAVLGGFVLGMDGVLVVLTTVSVGALIAVTRSAQWLSLVSVTALIAAAVLLLRGDGQVLCRRLEAMPPDPLRAVSAGFVFSLTGCPGCAPVVVSLGAAAASTSALLSPVAIAAFLLGRALSLYVVAASGGRWLASGDVGRVRQVDRVIALVLLLAAAYTTYRLVVGDVTTVVPGDEGVLAAPM